MTMYYTFITAIALIFLIALYIMRRSMHLERLQSDLMRHIYSHENVYVRDYASYEMARVSHWRPFMRVLFGGNFIKSYGPVCQFLWDYGPHSDPTTNRIWWASYWEIYLQLDRKTQRYIDRKYYGLTMILHRLHPDLMCEIIYRFEQQDMEKSNSCGIGAAEYDNIMAAQEMMNGL